ncbi:transposase [Arcanobacterium bovis]|nr:transposase [Arcanobacterium bovis]
MADGTYFQDWRLIVAFNGHHVIGWQWAEKENKAAYLAALSRFPPPQIVVIDGHKAAFEAVRQVWPGVLIQRCLFHTKARVRQLITMRPRTQCGIEIKQLTDMLSAIRNPIQASSWLVAYYQWEQRWEKFLKERTYRGVRDNSWHDVRTWQYTHRELRAIRSMYRGMIKYNTLFAYLTPLINNPNATPLPRTTSPLEGGTTLASKICYAVTVA